MGPASLTAVFGMGTGVTSRVWSPGRRPGRRLRDASAAWTNSAGRDRERSKNREAGGTWTRRVRRGRRVAGRPVKRGLLAWRWPTPACPGRRRGAAGAGRGGQAAWLLGPVGCDGRPPCTPGLSTWWSPRSLRTSWCRRPRLGAGFALRCLQRLSVPDLATRRCR